MGAVTIGVDIGQQRDPTAIVVTEKERITAVDRGWRVPVSSATGREIQRDVEYSDRYSVRHLERLPLGTPYPDVANRIATVVRGVKARVHGQLLVMTDCTGVGAPIVDLVRQAITGSGITVVAVTFTHGDRYERRHDSASLGKAYLVSRLQVLLQIEALKLPRTSEAEQLADELMNYEIKVTQNGNDTYGAFKVGTHDDLATALGLSVVDTARSRQLITF